MFTPKTAPECDASGCCDDGDLCTIDRCDLTDGSCWHQRKRCEDGYLDTMDRCDAATGDCVHEPFVDVSVHNCIEDDPACDDNDPCTLDWCDEDLWSRRQHNRCVHEPMACVAPDPCSFSQCHPRIGECQVVPKICDDGDPCTLDTCEPATGLCGFEPHPDPCDDADPCTREICVPMIGCRSAEDYDAPACSTGPECVEDQDCDDGDACTSDFCRPHLGRCGHLDRCDDGDACTVDSCEEGAAPGTGTAGCSTSPVDCASEAAECELSYCDAELGRCVRVPVAHCPLACTSESDCAIIGWHHPCLVDLACVDSGSGGVCTYDTLQCPISDDPCAVNACVPGVGCIERPVECPSDACNLGACDPETGLCTTVEVGCSDGIRCTADLCDPLTGCINRWASCRDDE